VVVRDSVAGESGVVEPDDNGRCPVRGTRDLDIERAVIAFARDRFGRDAAIRFGQRPEHDYSAGSWIFVDARSDVGELSWMEASAREPHSGSQHVSIVPYCLRVIREPGRTTVIVGANGFNEVQIN
jgi:hypothetical protein